MNRLRANLQRVVLELRAVPGMKKVFRFWYKIGEWVFIRCALRATKLSDPREIRAVYLRRGGGREELLPGASDLDFFLVLPALSAEEEMQFLKRFWKSFRLWRVVFPFWGEVLMGEETELLSWLQQPTVRSHEAHFGWKLLAGTELRSNLETAWEPDSRDVFSEALKAYWEILQTTLKVRDESFRANVRVGSHSAVHFRHAAKAVLDLFRLHWVERAPLSARPKIWRATRRDLLSFLPKERYGEELALLAPLLELRNPLFSQQDPFALFSALLHRCCTCLHEMAVALEEHTTVEKLWHLCPQETGAVADRYSLSVRELFAERMLLRHEGKLSRIVLSEQSTHFYILLPRVPPLPIFREIIQDLRDVNFSFDRSSVAMPLTEKTFQKMESIPFFDSPFHAYSGHRLVEMGAEGELVTRQYQPNPAEVSEKLLQKCFTELSFSLRLPPVHTTHFLERSVGQVLSLRVAAQFHELSPTFSSALTRFRDHYPERAKQLEALLAPYLEMEEEQVEQVNAWLNKLKDSAPSAARAQALLAHLQVWNERCQTQAISPHRASDLWINLTPFLRMEMGTMKERYSEHRAPLKV